MNSQPLITVAMPIYNAGEYLRLAVLSIVKQTFTNWELLIIDDGSTDHALNDIQDIISADTRICVLRDGKNKGLAARLNECIDLAKGEYIARMDQDDVSYPERFAKQLQAFNTNPLLDLVAVRAISISEQNEAIGMLPWRLSHVSICARPWQGFYLPHPTWMAQTSWFKKYRYAQPAHYFCEDQELLLRSYTNSHFVTLDEALFAYRIRNIVNTAKLRKTRIAVFRMQWENFLLKQQYWFAVLSLLVMVSRIALDKKNAIYPAKIQKIADVVIKDWEQLLMQLSDSSNKVVPA